MRGVKSRTLGHRIAMGSLLALLAPPCAILSQTNTVSEPVGFVRLTIPTNTEVMVAAPFHFLPGSDINEAFAWQLKGATNESTADIIRV
jgi:hypothetical protein